MEYSKVQVFWFGFFSIFAYLVSTFSTITYIYGLKVNILEFVHLISLAILFMAGAWFTGHEASSITNVRIEDGKRKYTYRYGVIARTGLIILYIMCTIISIGTNACMAFQAMARDSGHKLVEKTKFENQQMMKQAAAAIIESNKAYNSSLLSEKDTLVKKQVKQVDGWKSKMVSERQKELNKASSTAESYNSKISSNINESKKQQVILNSEVQPLTEVTSSPLSNMFKEEETTKAIFILLLLLSVTVDAIAFFFTNLFAKAKFFRKKKSSGPVTPPENKKAIPEFEQKNKSEQAKKTLQVAHAGNILSFASKGCKEVEQASKEKSKQVLSKSNIVNYLNEMYKLHEQGDSFGYKKISGNIGISQTAAYKIRNHIEELDIIDGTKIIMSRDKALLAIRKGA